jgi:hypothetical protein
LINKSQPKESRRDKKKSHKIIFHLASIGLKKATRIKKTQKIIFPLPVGSPPSEGRAGGGGKNKKKMKSSSISEVLILPTA